MKNKKLTFTVEEAKKRMENYCAYQDRCHQEIERKLYTMQMIPEAREVIILHLMEQDFLNEERFSKSFARGKFRIKSWGKQRIIRELKMRNISAYNINTALGEIDDEIYSQTLTGITQKRFDLINESNVYKKRKRLTDYLMRKGYENDLIYEAVRAIFKTKK